MAFSGGFWRFVKGYERISGGWSEVIQGLLVEVTGSQQEVIDWDETKYFPVKLLSVDHGSYGHSK